MFHRPLIDNLRARCTVLFLTALITAPVAADDTNLASQIQQLKPNVIATGKNDSPETHQRLRRMIGNDVGKRLRAVNVRDLADWKSIKNRADWEQRARRSIEALRKSLGTWPDPPTDLKVRVTRSDKRSGYVVDNIVFESRPGLLVTAHRYRPLQPGRSMPGIVISHSHHRPKEQGELQDMGASWARRGCVVIVPDHVGHGERRQHPFAAASDYKGEFRVSRQDYYFRYNVGMQLHLAGDSLMGWMVWDLMRSVDLLLSQPGVDPKRIVMLGAVAGGGDPCAVAAALDRRIAAAVPFNFGGPQPGERDRLDENSEETISYTGSGGWESTRNLRLSARDGFLPYVIVGSLVPRRLIYAHEFTWNRRHDPIWQRFQTIWGKFYDHRDNLAFTHGFGKVSQASAEASHCTNIGPIHRKLIDPAFKEWFGIEPPAAQQQDRRETRDTFCLSGPTARDLKLTPVCELAGRIAADRIRAMRGKLQEKPTFKQRELLRTAWGRLLGNVSPYRASIDEKRSEPFAGGRVEYLVVRGEREIEVPTLLLTPSVKPAVRVPIAIMFAQSGKAALLKQRADVIASLLQSGVAVCLPDLRGTGETRPADYRGRRSAATGISSTELMLGQTLVGARLRDLRTVIALLRNRNDVDPKRMAIWGDSLAQLNGPNEDVAYPMGIDAEPHRSEPLGQMLALLTGLFEDDIAVVVAARGGLISIGTTFGSQHCHFPHDIVVPGAANAGDFADVAAAMAPRPLMIAGVVDGLNRRATARDVIKAFGPATLTYAEAEQPKHFAIWQDANPGPKMAQWLLRQLGN